MFQAIKAWWAVRRAQLSTKIGAAIALVSSTWPAVQGYAPTAIQQLQQTNAGAAQVMNIAFVVMGAALIHWNSTKGQA